MLKHKGGYAWVVGLWEYVKEVMGLRKKEMIRLRGFLERNKIFFDLFSTFILSIAPAVLGYQLNARNVEINEENMETNKRQLDIVERGKMPRFAIKGNFVPSHTGSPSYGKKMAKYSYTITNVGENISEVSVRPESYIYFYMPTNVENEYYIFKCIANDFRIDGSDSMYPIEKDKEFVFYEYVLKHDGSSEWEATAKNVSKHFPNIKYDHKNLVEISYRDYMGEKQKEIFEFSDWDIREAENEEGCILLNIDVSGELGYDPEVSEMAMEIIKKWKNG